ncbi:MAG: proton-conducting membrane transporter [Defluviitaleaceae bacterium]|nr:proton-conducting membrane transporter [Defluviitaleaceae bacterium]
MLTFFVIVPVLIAVLLYMLSTHKVAKFIAVFFQSALAVFAFFLVLSIHSEELTIFVGTYDDVMGIILYADALAAAFVLLTTFIFLLVSIYTLNQKESRTFWFLLFLLEAALIGLFFTRDLFNVFVLAEVSTVVIAVLLMYDRGKRSMFFGMVFLMLSVIAMQFYLLGLGYVYMMTGAMDMAYVAERITNMTRSELALPYALIMTTIGFKCALVPFFSWTPKVRVYPQAPTAVMAILSGLQIKSAIYLLLRFQGIFGVGASSELFLIIGIAAGLFGAFMAICQTDIRMILAYHTISQVGLIIIGINSGSYYSYIGGMYHIVSHAMFKTTLFLSAGIIVHSYGTGDAYKIRGVLKRMPLVAIGSIAAVLGITGAPLFIGSISKYFIAYDVPPLLNAATIIISLGTIISFIKYSYIFFGDSDLVGDIPVAERSRTIPTLILGVICLIGGVFGIWFIEFLFHTKVSISLIGYIQKSLIFAASVLAGLFIYKRFVKGNAFLVRFGAINFGFKAVCFSMSAFFAVILITVAFL